MLQWTEPNVQHYVLWVGESWDKERVQKLLEEKLPAHDILWFENPQARRSVKALPHYQIFTRQRTQSRL